MCVVVGGGGACLHMLIDSNDRDTGREKEKLMKYYVLSFGNTMTTFELNICTTTALNV